MKREESIERKLAPTANLNPLVARIAEAARRAGEARLAR